MPTLLRGALRCEDVMTETREMRGKRKRKIREKEKKLKVHFYM